MLGSGVAMLQTPVLDGLSFDPFPFQQDGVAAPEVDSGGREVIQALVVAPVVVVLDKCTSSNQRRPMSLVGKRDSWLVDRSVRRV